MKDDIEQAKQLSQEIGYKFEYIAPGFLAMILTELRRLNTNIETFMESVQSQSDNKTPAMVEIEARFGKSISELLQERKDKSARQIADEFGISKSTISEWRRQFLE